jgi:uroporphyrinogen decarboxylase
MTGRDRVLTALRRGTADRVPTFEWVISPRVIEAMTGQTDEIEFVDRMDLDGISVGLNERKTAVDDRHYLDEWGITRVSYDEYPNPVGHPIKDAEDLKKFRVPDPDAPYRFDRILWAQERLGREKAIIARVRDVFSQPRDLMGFEDFLMSFYLEPELAMSLMQICVDYSTKIARNLKSLGIEIIVVGDDIATNSGLLMSPDMYREFVLPYFRNLIRNLKSMDLLVIKHSDGDLRAVLADLVDTGIDCIDPIDPLGHMDMAAVKAEFGDRIALKGNIDCVSTLVDKDVSDVVAETRQCILDGGRNGGLVISSSNSIHSGINPRNYKAFLDAVKTYGNYPVQ